MILSFDASGIPSGLAGWTLGASLAACVLYGIAGWIGDGTVRSGDKSGALLRGRRLGLAGGCLWGGWLLQALVTLLDWWWAWSTSPRFGFAPALSATAWLVLAVYGVESRLLPLAEARRALALLALSCLFLAQVFPGDVLPHVAPLAPLHWGLGIASYGLFGVAVLHAIWLNRAERQLRQKSLALRMPGLPLLQLERLTYRFVEAGFVVLTAALLLGWWVGTVWRWDHKAVFSMLGWAVLAGLLVGRHAFGWRGLQATRWLYAGAGLLFLAYVGSRFVLEVLVHPR
jgi:ABC-type uncharacterized transport system permease subunit